MVNYGFRASCSPSLAGVPSRVVHLQLLGLVWGFQFLGFPVLVGRFPAACRVLGGLSEPLRLQVVHVLGCASNTVRIRGLQV